MSGAAAGLAVTAFAPHWTEVEPSTGSRVTFAAVCAGAALLPDLDHPRSTATRHFALASWLASRVIRPLSAIVYDLTKARRDTGKGTHRGLTHTLIAAGLLGWGINVASAAWGAPVLIATLFICIALAIKGLDSIVPGPPSLVIAAMLVVAIEWRLPSGTSGTAGWLGFAVMLGMVVHTIGDMLTESGAPLLWPLPIGRRRWLPIGLPRRLRFRTGGPVEMWFVGPALTVAVFVLMAMPFTVPIVSQLLPSG